jgi:hypothetical protein
MRDDLGHWSAEIDEQELFAVFLGPPPLRDSTAEPRQAISRKRR